MAFDPLPPLALYVHIPWCERKCPYCDFNSHEGYSLQTEPDYIQALLRDLDSQLVWAGGRKLVSIFIGGGTPSLFSARAIATLLAGIDQRLPISDGTEITMECNPGSAEASRFAGYRAAGVNRLSIGVQSFDENLLKRLGRVHDREAALRAPLLAREAGFTRYNIDLMHGLPEQSAEQASDDLRQAIELHGGHLSWYQLTIEPNTVFYRQPPELPVEDELAEIQDRGERLLAAAGFDQYEVSAFAQPNEFSRHNHNYWTFGDYLAIGAGAHGKVTQASGVHRFQRTRLPKDYLQALGQQGQALRSSLPAAAPALKPLNEALLAGEFMLNVLRLKDGVDRQLFVQRTGLEWQWVSDTVARCQAGGLLSNDPKRIVATPLGYRFLNDLIGRFLPD